MKIFLSLCLILTMLTTGASVVFADPTLEPKDTLQKDQGPGNMDVPTETRKKKPAATPAPGQ